MRWLTGLTAIFVFIFVLVSGVVGFWFFRLRTQPMPVVVANQTSAEIAMFVNGVPAHLYTGMGACEAGGSTEAVTGLKPGEEGWFCRTGRGGRAVRICYEARSATSEVLAAVQWDGDDWLAHDSRLAIMPNDPRRECNVTVGS